jgi:hypothetical protein
MVNRFNSRPHSFDLYMDEDEDFVKSEILILKNLMQSKEKGNAVGLNVPSLSAGMIITAVDDVVLAAGEVIVTLKQYDMSGYMLPHNRINLNDIESLYPFTSSFKNPFLENLDREKTWFF